MSSEIKLSSKVYDLSQGYTKALSELYKENKLSPANDKLQIFVNKKKGFIFVKKAGEKGGSGTWKITSRKMVKFLKKEAEGVDLKTKQNAAKALLLLGWKDPVDAGKVNKIYPGVLGAIAGTKQAQFLEAFSGEVTIDRSKEGGNGVYFIRFQSEEYSKPVVVKFTKKSTPVIWADLVFRRAGFVTPKTRAVSRDSELGQAVAKKFDDWVENAPIELQKQIKQQYSRVDGVVLFMDVVNATDLKTLSEMEIRELLESEEFGHQIGKMIVFDALIGNSDRLSEMRCNLGNIMVNSDGKLVLIDHEIEVVESMEKLEKALQWLTALELDDKGFERIVDNFRGALKYNRQTMGGVELDEYEVQLFAKNIANGSRMALKEMQKIFSDQKLANQFFRIDPINGSKAYKIIESVLELSTK